MELRRDAVHDGVGGLVSLLGGQRLQDRGPGVRWAAFIFAVAVIFTMSREGANHQKTCFTLIQNKIYLTIRCLRSRWRVPAGSAALRLREPGGQGPHLQADPPQARGEAGSQLGWVPAALEWVVAGLQVVFGFEGAGYKLVKCEL